MFFWFLVLSCYELPLLSFKNVGVSQANRTEKRGAAVVEVEEETAKRVFVLVRRKKIERHTAQFSLTLALCQKKTSSQSRRALYSSGNDSTRSYQFAMRSAVASGRSAVVTSSSGAATAAPRPMRPSNLPTTSTTSRPTAAIVAPASLSLSGPARGHCAGSSRLGRSNVRYYDRRRCRERMECWEERGRTRAIGSL